MKGSEKQVEWATSIKQQWISTIDKCMHDMHSRVDYRDFEWIVYDLATQVRNEMKEKIEKIEESKFFIDQRGCPLEEMFNKNLQIGIKKAKKEEAEIWNVFAE